MILNGLPWKWTVIILSFLRLHILWLVDIFFLKMQALMPLGTWSALLNVFHKNTFDRDSVQFSSVAQSCPTLCDLKDCSRPGLPVHHQLPKLTQSHVHWVGDAMKPSHPLSSPAPLAFNLSHHQGLFQWVSSLHQVAKVLEFQHQHQSFQWTLRSDFL